MLLKIDMHMHAKEDLNDRDEILSYNTKQLINLKHKQKFDIICFSFHNSLYFRKESFEYARSKGILLIPSIELTIKHCFKGRYYKHHILLINSLKFVNKFKQFFIYDDLKYQYKLVTGNLTLDTFLLMLKKYDSNDLIIIPAHSYYGSKEKRKSTDVVLNNLLPYISGLEYCQSYFSFFNPYNKKILKFAKKHDLSVVANSDFHIKEHNNKKHYSLVDFDLNFDEILSKIDYNNIETDNNYSLLIHELIKSINLNKVTYKSKSPGLINMLKILYKMKTWNCYN